LAPKTSFWRDAQFDTIRLCLIKVAGRVTEMVTRIKIALPTAYLHVCLAGYDGVDFGLPFDVCGDRAGSMRPVKRLPEATLGMKRADTRLTGLLTNTPIRVIKGER